MYGISVNMKMNINKLLQALLHALSKFIQYDLYNMEQWHLLLCYNKQYSSLITAN